MQNRSEQAPIQSMSYADLIKDNNNQSQPQVPQNLNMLPGPLLPPPQQQQPQQQPQPQYIEQPLPHLQQQQFYGSPPPVYYHQNYIPEPFPKDVTTDPHQAPSSPPKGFLESLVSNKSLWITAVVIFAAITYIIPKLRMTVPAFVDVNTGGLNTVGVGTLSLVAAVVIHGVHRFVVN
jgi:hypothetical protein